MSESRDMKALFEKGLRELDQAEFEEAKDCFEQVVVEDASNSEAWFQLALCYLETGHADLAIEALKRTLRLDPKNADASYLLGNAYGSSGFFENALEMYQHALEIQPHHSKSEEFLLKTQSLIQSREHYRSAARLFDEGKLKDRSTDDLQWLNQAFRELIQSVAAFPQSPAQNEFESCIKLILERGSEQWIEAPITEVNRFWAEHCERGRNFLTAKLWPGAHQAYSEATQYDPYHSFIHHALGIAQYQVGNLEGAMNAWQEALDLDPEFDFARLGRLRIPKRFQSKPQ